MIIWNQKAVETLKKYIDNVIQTWNWTQFFLLSGPNLIWKLSLAKELIKNYLWDYFYSDCLFVEDYEPYIWKKHTIPVSIDKEDKRWIKFEDESVHQNYGAIEMNEWLQNSSFSGMKFLLIENIHRMSNAAINAFLKSTEEPFQNRFIIATVPHISLVLDTIRSRCITIPFSVLTNDEMEVFVKTNQISFKDNLIKDVIIAMAMWKPWFLKKIYEKVSSNEDLEKNLKTLILWLGNNQKLKWELMQSFKVVSEEWLLNDFIEWWINYSTQKWNFEQANRWIKIKKYIQSNVNLESALLYGLMD